MARPQSTLLPFVLVTILSVTFALATVFLGGNEQFLQWLNHSPFRLARTAVVGTAVVALLLFVASLWQYWKEHSSEPADPTPAPKKSECNS